MPATTTTQEIFFFVFVSYFHPLYVGPACVLRAAPFMATATTWSARRHQVFFARHWKPKCLLKISTKWLDARLWCIDEICTDLSTYLCRAQNVVEIRNMRVTLWYVMTNKLRSNYIYTYLRIYVMMIYDWQLINKL